MKQHILTEGVIAQKLKEFRLSGMAGTLELRNKQAQEDNLSCLEFLALLCEDEENMRDGNKRKRLYKQARLPALKSIEDFNFAFQPSVRKSELLDLATCGFVEKHANIFFVGQPGTGKTHLSIALAVEALKFGKTVLFTTVWDM